MKFWQKLTKRRKVTATISIVVILAGLGVGGYSIYKNSINASSVTTMPSMPSSIVEVKGEVSRYEFGIKNYWGSQGGGTVTATGSSGNNLGSFGVDNDGNYDARFILPSVPYDVVLSPSATISCLPTPTTVTLRGGVVNQNLGVSCVALGTLTGKVTKYYSNLSNGSGTDIATSGDVQILSPDWKTIGQVNSDGTYYAEPFYFFDVTPTLRFHDAVMTFRIINVSGNNCRRSDPKQSTWRLPGVFIPATLDFGVVCTSPTPPTSPTTSGPVPPNSIPSTTPVLPVPGASTATLPTVPTGAALSSANSSQVVVADAGKFTSQVITSAGTFPTTSQVTGKTFNIISNTADLGKIFTASTTQAIIIKTDPDTGETSYATVDPSTLSASGLEQIAQINALTAPLPKSLPGRIADFAKALIKSPTLAILKAGLIDVFAPDDTTLVGAESTSTTQMNLTAGVVVIGNGVYQIVDQTVVAAHDLNILGPISKLTATELASLPSRFYQGVKLLIFGGKAYTNATVQQLIQAALQREHT
ncbi:MAG: hypothetical protein NTW79_00820 [Candidatus Berkelbacteria bacterium]|nr:hypothetical protein [Candidatus Berkelbacteria bacterium]